MAFTATVARLPSGATVQRVFLRDRVAGVTFDVSGAPGGPPDDPAITHVVLGTSDADLAVGLGGVGLTTDGRFLYFAPIPEPGTPPGACYLFDVTTASSFALPAGIGGSGYQCPSMSLNGRFFAARDDTGKLVRLHDRATQQTVSVVLPGLASQDIVLSVYASPTGRYIVADVAQLDSTCGPIFCFRYAMILDRSTGQTARGPAHPGTSNLAGMARLQLLEQLWTEFELPRYHSRFTASLTGCELIDRQTRQVVPLPRLRELGTQFSFDCGRAVNGGQQILFESLLHLAPGEVHAQTPDMHVYTRSSGLVTRLSTGIDGNTFPLRVSTISQNGRYLLGATTSAWMINATGVTDVVVLDLGVLASSSGGGLSAPSNLQSTVVGTFVQLAWNAPSQGVASSYAIEAGSGPGASNLAVVETRNALTSFSASVLPGTFYVRVRAQSGGVLGPASNEVVVVVPGGCAAPAAPGNLTGTVAGSLVQLAWQAGGGRHHLCPRGRFRARLEQRRRLGSRWARDGVRRIGTSGHVLRPSARAQRLRHQWAVERDRRSRRRVPAAGRGPDADGDGGRAHGVALVVPRRRRDRLSARGRRVAGRLERGGCRSGRRDHVGNRRASRLVLRARAGDKRLRCWPGFE